MSVSRRGYSQLIATALFLGTVPGVSEAATSHLELVSVTLPDTIVKGETFDASATVENVGSETVRTRIQYNFEGDDIAGADVELVPGEQRTVRLPDMEYEWLTQGGTREFEPGTYTHSMGVRGGPRKRAEVRIVEDTSDGDTPVETPPPGLQLVEPQLPENLVRGESTFVGATVENVRSSAITIDLNYVFENEPVFFQEAVEIPAETTQEIGFPGVTVEAIEESLGRELNRGLYRHSFGIPDGIRLTGEVEIVDAAGSGGATATPGGVEQTVVQDEASGTARETPAEADGSGRDRGFFSNSGDEPEYLSNPFNLTTLGFVLSVAGIAHQMLEGR